MIIKNMRYVKSLVLLGAVLLADNELMDAREFDDLKTGDLIFKISGGSEFSDAITSATGTDSLLNFDHVGIIEKTDKDSVVVIEASPRLGVHITPLKEFVDETVTINGKPGLVVKRLCGDYPFQKIIERAKTFIGQEYDWWFLPDNGKMYCSELIYESYLDNEGKHIFQTVPMNFRANDGSMPDFWIELFEKIGEEIPEGKLGTNPNDLFNSNNLIEILRFF